MKSLLPLALLLAVFSPGSRLLAASVTVSTTTDEVNGNTASIAALIGSPGGAGISLREAILAANNSSGADTVIVPAGTYTLTRSGNDSTGQNGDLDINGSLTLTGAGPGVTIIQGAADANFTGSIGDKIIGINQDGTFTNLTVFISGFTIRYGRNTVAFNDPSFAYTGAGIDVFLTGIGNSTTISNCVLTGNENVNSYGGAINVDSGTSFLPGDVNPNTANRGSVRIVDCVIAGNKSKMSGAGINLYSDIHNVTITNCVITNNLTTGIGGVEANGAGINLRHSYGGTVLILGSNIASNSAAGVGAGVNLSGNQHVVLGSSMISNNVATLSPASGGGVAVTALGTAGFTANMSVTNCTIASNHAENGTTATGGGVYFASAYSATFANCIVTNNTADLGAGIANYTGNAGVSLTVDGCTVISNTASSSGGGLASLNASCVTTLTKSTLHGNTAGISGGGIYVGGGTVNATYNRIANNKSPTGRAGTQTAGTVNALNNWWGTNTPAGLLSGSVSFTPWLQLRHAANPATILAGGSATLTATFQTNSAGTYVAPANLTALNNVPLTFNNAVRGNLSAAATVINASAIGTATFTATSGGIGGADAMVDEQTVTATVTINQAPQITCPLELVTNTAPGSCARTIAFSANVIAGYPAPTLTYKIGPATITSPYSFPRGTNTVQVTAANGILPDASCSFNLIVNDTEPPIVTCSTNITVSAIGFCPAVVNFSVSGADNCALASVIANPPSGSAFPVGTNVVAVTATDSAGNTNICSFKVAVLAGTPPQLSLQRSGTNVILSWPKEFGCYRLQSTPALLTPPTTSVWTNFSGPLTTNGNTVFATNEVSATSRFFRLSE